MNQVEMIPGVVFVVAETVDIAPFLPAPAQPLKPSPAAEPDVARSPRPFYVSLAASVAWFIAVAGLVLTGAMFPIEGNVLAYLVLMAGLFCAAFTALTCPRPDGDEEFITIGGCQVAQCAPSRNTLTGRAQ